VFPHGRLVAEGSTLRCNVRRARTSLNTCLRCPAGLQRGEKSHLTRPFTALGGTKQRGFGVTSMRAGRSQAGAWGGDGGLQPYRWAWEFRSASRVDSPLRQKSCSRPSVPSGRSLTCRMGGCPPGRPALQTPEPAFGRRTSMPLFS